ncbi:MAG: hypothetical protein JW963_19505 [Anaerolineales bacterium]|nr:hypothetical protein [Anaerolineales bacterium]
MADKPKNNLPKVPPFIIPGASNQYAEKPPPQTAHVVQAPKTATTNDKQAAQQGIFSSLILLISVISLGVAMLSGAWFAYSVLSAPEKNPDAPEIQEKIPPDATGSESNPSETADEANDVLSKVVVVGLAYAVGWIFSVIGVRSLGNLILPYVIQVYAWVVLGGILILQILIIYRLYQQEYLLWNYIRYLLLFGAGLIALVGLHVILEKHSLVPFGVIILLASLGHLYAFVYHYVFVAEVAHERVWGDIIFFFVTTTVSILMLAHLGLLNGLRRSIDRMFNPKDNHFVPPH